jgi:hypothetical protein
MTEDSQYLFSSLFEIKREITTGGTRSRFDEGGDEREEDLKILDEKQPCGNVGMMSIFSSCSKLSNY